MLARREVEAALVPVIEYQHMLEVAVVPRVCIGARTAVRSVVLATRCADLHDVRTIALDISSRTSATLIQIIFREFLGRQPLTSPCQPDLNAMLNSHDAALIIGDPGMTFSRKGLYMHDMASLWRKYTGLGFVFAMWMAYEEDMEAVRAIDFAGARDEGLAHTEEIAAQYANELHLPRTELRSYLRENIAYELDNEMQAGLDLFYRLAHKHGLVQSVRPLKMIGPSLVEQRTKG